MEDLFLLISLEIVLGLRRNRKAISHCFSPISRQIASSSRSSKFNWLYFLLLFAVLFSITVLLLVMLRLTKPYRLKPFSGRGLTPACFSLLHFYLELGIF
jgi:hypothetical protein